MDNNYGKYIDKINRVNYFVHLFTVYGESEGASVSLELPISNKAFLYDIYLEDYNFDNTKDCLKSYSEDFKKEFWKSYRFKFRLRQSDFSDYLSILFDFELYKEIREIYESNHLEEFWLDKSIAINYVKAMGKISDIQSTVFESELFEFRLMLESVDEVNIDTSIKSSVCYEREVLKTFKEIYGDKYFFEYNAVNLMDYYNDIFKIKLLIYEAYIKGEKIDMLILDYINYHSDDQGIARTVLKEEIYTLIAISELHPTEELIHSVISKTIFCLTRGEVKQENWNLLSFVNNSSRASNVFSNFIIEKYERETLIEPFNIFLISAKSFKEIDQYIDSLKLAGLSNLAKTVEKNKNIKRRKKRLFIKDFILNNEWIDYEYEIEIYYNLIKKEELEKAEEYIWKLVDSELMNLY